MANKAEPAAGRRLRLTPLEWLICSVAAIGFLFDTYELLMLPLVGPPALAELLGVKPGSPEMNVWMGRLFYVPAIFGAGFGLLGGWLTDRFGRRRVLVASILLYAVGALASAFVTSPGQLLALRCVVFVGVCVEFVAGTAWLAELFTDPARRERVLGYTQAFSSLGGLLVAWVYGFVVHHADALPAIGGGHSAWRYTLVSGLIPALPLLIVRPWLPESPAWRDRKEAGTLARPRLSALFSPELRRTTIVTTILVAASYALAFGAIQQATRIVPGLADVHGLERPAQQQVVAATQKLQEVGGLLGRIALAVLAVRIASRRGLLRIFQVPALVVFPLLFWNAMRLDSEAFRWGLALCGFVAIAQFSFWGNYLPRVYPTHLRGTGESFAANVGGRLLGVSAAWISVNLANQLTAASPAAALAKASAIVALAAAVIGIVVSFALPEPRQADLPG
jgi:MFS family permease